MQKNQHDQMQMKKQFNHLIKQLNPSTVPESIPVVPEEEEQVCEGGVCSVPEPTKVHVTKNTAAKPPGNTRIVVN